jgi:L-threonylcarbamoyladenylate synthase
MKRQYDTKDAARILREGGTILYPTDTIWGIGCDATNARAVKKVYAIKERLNEKSLIILVKDREQLEKYVESIPDLAYDMMESINDPLTIIYPGARNLAPNVAASDGTVGIRIPKDDFCLELLQAFGKPITSTSANLSGDPSPVSFSKISDAIKNAVDYIVPFEETGIRMPRPSTIIRIDPDGNIQIIRN